MCHEGFLVVDPGFGIAISVPLRFWRCVLGVEPAYQRSGACVKMPDCSSVPQKEGRYIDNQLYHPSIISVGDLKKDDGYL